MQAHMVRTADNARIAGLHQQAYQKYTLWQAAQEAAATIAGLFVADTVAAEYGLIIFQYLLEVIIVSKLDAQAAGIVPPADAHVGQE